MLLLMVIVGFLFGVLVTNKWGNHRAKYYRKHMGEALVLAQKTQEANKLIIQEMEKMSGQKRTERVNNMYAGLEDAIADMARSGL